MCGIFGIIQNKKRKFDKRAFITMGIANDSRGKDSCGIFIDKWAEYGVNEDKLFVDFFHNSTLLQNLTDAKIILGHCRKASVGIVNEQNAQPVVIKENGNPKFVLIHNGTIYNYKELANKYIPDIDITGMTDSQVMANIFYNKGYDVLSEYVGGGMFVMYDLRTDKVLMFKGCSMAKSTDDEPSEERPCYFVKTNEGLVFSSICEILEGLYYNDSVYVLPSNLLLIVKNSKIYVEKKIDRSKCTQYKPAVMYTAAKYVGSCYNSNYIEYNKKLYYYMDPSYKRAHGEYFVSSYGLINPVKSSWHSPYYFYNGMLLYDERSYDFLTALAKTCSENSPKFASALQLLSVSPIVDLETKKMYKANLLNFKLQPCKEVSLPLCSLIAKQDTNGIVFTHVTYPNVLAKLSDQTFEEIVDYVSSI